MKVNDVTGNYIILSNLSLYKSTEKSKFKFNSNIKISIKSCIYTLNSVHSNMPQCYVCYDNTCMENGNVSAGFSIKLFFK